MIVRRYRLTTTSKKCVKIIKSTIEPKNWHADGVFVATLDDGLVIRQTRQVQSQVHALLKQLDLLIERNTVCSKAVGLAGRTGLIAARTGLIAEGTTADLEAAADLETTPELPRPHRPLSRMPRRGAAPRTPKRAAHQPPAASFEPRQLASISVPTVGPSPILDNGQCSRHAPRDAAEVIIDAAHQKAERDGYTGAVSADSRRLALPPSSFPE